MNKQDKKEIMNLIKYKKMLGGRRMELNEAIEFLKEYAEWARAHEYEVPIMLADDLELAADMREGEFL